MRTKRGISLGFAVVIVAAAVFCVAPAEAAVKKTDYQGKIIAKSAETLTLKPGQAVTYKLSVKNTGKTTWTRAGSKFVSIYTYFPKYRTSVFYDKSWYHKDQPVRMKEASVKPGQTATFEFKLTAPAKTGTYEEGFYAAAEDFTWIAGTQVKIPITVATEVAKIPNSNNQIPNPSAVTTPYSLLPTPSSSPLAATLLIKSFQDRVVVAGGQPVSVTVGFKNLGSVVWQTRILRVRGTSIAASDPALISLADTSWPNALEPSRVREPISPGNVGYFTFNILAPVKRGDYTLPLKLVIDDAEVPGVTFDIPVTVTEDAPQLPTQEIPITTGLTEPNIRVGLWSPPGPVTISNSVPFEIRDANGQVLGTVPPEATVDILYSRLNGMVTAVTSVGSWTAAAPMRFVPTDPAGLFRVPNFAGWDATLYENRFRGTLELNYYQPNDNVWLIEELPLEQYLRGLAETSNSSAYEYQKALVVAARTYAYFVHSIGGKYDLFDVKPSAADQVYRAYGSETIRPSVVRAVEETAGQMVTYADEIVVTPYFSRSDGRTRAWEEVWCCKVKPWLKSVPAPHDAGKTLWGHGVGMSAADALGWAVDGMTYDWILKYFYTGTVLKRIY